MTDNVSDIVDIEDPSVVVEKASIPVEFIPHVCHRYTYDVVSDSVHNAVPTC